MKIIVLTKNSPFCVWLVLRSGCRPNVGHFSNATPAKKYLKTFIRAENKRSFSLNKKKSVQTLNEIRHFSVNNNKQTWAVNWLHLITTILYIWWEYAAERRAQCGCGLFDDFRPFAFCSKAWVKLAAHAMRSCNPAEKFCGSPMHYVEILWKVEFNWKKATGIVL